MKGLFGVLEFSKKRNELIRRSSKNEFVCSFLGEFDDTKSLYEIIWPLVGNTPELFLTKIHQFMISRILKFPFDNKIVHQIKNPILNLWILNCFHELCWMFWSTCLRLKKTQKLWNIPVNFYQKKNQFWKQTNYYYKKNQDL